MANCKKCLRPIKFARTNGKFYPVNLDGSQHDYDLCRTEQNTRFKTYGTPRIVKRMIGSAIGPQEITEEWIDLDGESLKFSESGFVTVGEEYKKTHPDWRNSQ